MPHSSTYQRSAVERALDDARTAVGGWARGHDRFVVIGVLLAVTPVPPACFLGLLVSLLNAALITAGRLARRERSSVALGLVAGLINSAVVVIAMSLLAEHFLDEGLGVLPDALEGVIRGLLDLLRSHPLWPDSPSGDDELVIPV